MYLHLYPTATHNNGYSVRCLDLTAHPLLQYQSHVQRLQPHHSAFPQCSTVCMENTAGSVGPHHLVFRFVAEFLRRRTAVQAALLGPVGGGGGLLHPLRERRSRGRGGGRAPPGGSGDTAAVHRTVHPCVRKQKQASWPPAGTPNTDDCRDVTPTKLTDCHQTENERSKEKQ